LRADDIVQKARERAGLDAFDSDSFRPGLEIALAAVEAKKTRRPESAAWFENQFVSSLANRLKVADHLSRHPELLARPVARPIIVIGLPRTGSTLLSQLLGTDAALRSLLRWEVQYLVPPPTEEGLTRDPRCLALIEAERAQSTNPLPAMHYEPWDGPTECHAILSHDFKSAGLDPGLASMEYGQWLLDCDTGSTYAYHRKVLQLLQAHTKGSWSLKLPSDALNIRALMAAYPDARIVWTHRDPYRVTASFLSMMEAAQALHLTEPDRDYLLGYYPMRLREHLVRPMAVQDESAEDPFYHLFYSDLLADPLAEMRRLYAWLEQPFDTAEAGMARWLAENHQGKFGVHAYGLEKFGLTVEQLTPLFEDYLARFPVAREG
jgi:hypothetical protein